LFEEKIIVNSYNLQIRILTFTSLFGFESDAPITQLFLIMNISTALSFEQEFNLRVYKEQVKDLDLLTLQDMLIEVLRQSMVKENLLKGIIKDGI
jgi:Phycobilisome degradation protein nblA